MRSQQDGQVLSYVNDQIRRRYHRKKPDFSGFFHVLLRSFASILCPFFGVDPLFDPFMHLGRSKKPLNFYA